MSMIHTIIKINLSKEGYLPNLPPHLISDSEMCDAFLPKLGSDDHENPSYFYDNYPCISDSLSAEYEELVSCIDYHINQLRQSTQDMYILPDWVYSYMLGRVVSVNSSIRDKHDLLVLLNLDNIDDNFTEAAALSCLSISREWLRKLPSDRLNHRPPTMFGENHVIKSLRLGISEVI